MPWHMITDDTSPKASPTLRLRPHRPEVARPLRSATGIPRQRHLVLYLLLGRSQEIGQDNARRKLPTKGPSTDLEMCSRHRSGALRDARGPPRRARLARTKTLDDLTRMHDRLKAWCRRGNVWRLYPILALGNARYNPRHTMRAFPKAGRGCSSAHCQLTVNRSESLFVTKPSPQDKRQGFKTNGEAEKERD